MRIVQIAIVALGIIGRGRAGCDVITDDDGSPSASETGAPDWSAIAVELVA